MAFRDSDGKITIDDVAAGRDVTKLKSSIEAMETAIDELDEISIQADEFEGNTKLQIKEAAAALKKEINDSVSKMKEVINIIQMTVAKYQRLDAELRDTIKNSMN